MLLTGSPASAGTKRLTRFAMLLAIAVILHVVEGGLPPPLPVPGAKLGLANVAALICLSALGLKPALLLTGLRTVLGSLLQGSFLGFGFVLSFGAGLVSTLSMGFLQRMAGRRFSLIGLSLCGALIHNLTQLALASLVVRHFGILSYLPYMLLGSLPTGALTGLVAIAALSARGAALSSWLAGSGPAGGRPGPDEGSIER
jgi:heptaprenyl diphosphate synthase